MSELAPTKSHTPDQFENARLLAADFDGTIAETFERSPRGIGVQEAYDEAILSVFGKPSLEIYKAQGGLRNRAPSEITRELRPYEDVDAHAEMTKQLTDKKLDILLGEIGTRFANGHIWPRPIEGYLELRELVAEQPSIDEAVISSGHVPFIEETYRAWGQETPSHIIAEETIRRLAIDLSMEPPVKPSRFLMDLAHQSWRTSYKVFKPNGEASRTLYVGDDMCKDGEFAKNSGVDFVLIDRLRPRKSWEKVGKKLQLQLLGETY